MGGWTDGRMDGWVTISILFVKKSSHHNYLEHLNVLSAHFHSYAKSFILLAAEGVRMTGMVLQGSRLPQTPLLEFHVNQRKSSGKISVPVTFPSLPPCPCSCGF